MKIFYINKTPLFKLKTFYIYINHLVCKLKHKALKSLANFLSTL